MQNSGTPTDSPPDRSWITPFAGVARVGVLLLVFLDVFNHPLNAVGCIGVMVLSAVAFSRILIAPPEEPGLRTMRNVSLGINVFFFALFGAKLLLL